MRQTRITWFLVCIPLGLLFIIWGGITNPRPLIPGDVWLVLPGSILFVVGVLGILDDFLVVRRATLFLTSENADNKTLNELATILNLDVDHVRELVLRLRSQGKLSKHFDSNSGFLVSIQDESVLVCPMCNHPDLKGDFCSVCGVEVAIELKKMENE
ncbi:MAG: hypothetical protein FK733_06750 [Asgard group archaeon]|nr:hypothetical protein [Asgard group archaeon]